MPITPPLYGKEFERLLTDEEIVKAIERRLIVLDKPDVYLKERRHDLI